MATTLNPALLSKWILAYDNTASNGNAIAFPCGGAFGVHIKVPAAATNLVYIEVIDAGHTAAALLSHTRCNATVKITTGTGEGVAFAKALINWMTAAGTTDPTNPRNNRILELTDGGAYEVLGVKSKVVDIDFDTTS
tara:strand:+ start:2696 stop:3106 length:411 start_codon:yes stop_codon:yes gene_type:complete